MIENSGRQIARIVMDKIENDNAYANLALLAILRERAEADRREKAFATELVYGTMRNLLKIDFILGRLLSRPLNSLALSVRNCLRVALYQLLYLPDVPERAVIHSAVEDIKHSRYSGLAGLTNGVLRSYLRKKDQIDFPDRDRDPAAYLMVEYSTPRWLVERWIKNFGQVKAEKILQVSVERPPVTARINCYLSNSNQLGMELQSIGLHWVPGYWLDEAIRFTDLPVSLEELDAFKAGKIFIQDESSMLVAHVIRPRPGETIVDLCAAPGGKSTHMAELMQDSGRIYSIDDHQHKVDLIAQNARRMRLSCIQPVLADARHFQVPDGKKADRVLVDAPCSGTGVLRRRVDAKYRKKPEDLKILARTQREILSQAVTLVKPGGCLVYSTCTLEPEEDELQVEWFLDKFPQFEIERVLPDLPSNLKEYLDEPDQPWVKILPISNGGDGFFICRFRHR